MTRVLLIDDDAADVDLYSTGLHVEGFDVTTVSAPADLTAAMRTIPVDVIIFNLDGGFEWSQCETVSRMATVPFVVLTAHVRPDRGNFRRSRELNAAAFVAKPCTPASLAGVLRRVVAGESEIDHKSEGSTE